MQQRLMQRVVTMKTVARTESRGNVMRSVLWYSTAFTLGVSGSWRHSSVWRRWQCMISCSPPVRGHCRQSRCCGRLWFAVRIRRIRVLTLNVGCMGVAMVGHASVSKVTRGRAVLCSIRVLMLSVGGMGNVLVAFVSVWMGGVGHNAAFIHFLVVLQVMVVVATEEDACVTVGATVWQRRMHTRNKEAVERTPSALARVPVVEMLALAVQVSHGVMQTAATGA
eukprot:SAG11_NODE_11720_length_742_cov_0.984448_1_plen_223_part_00